MKAISDRALERLKQVSRLADAGENGYRLLEEIGRGGMGVVYRAEDIRLERQVALKVLEAEDDSGELAARLVREARVLAQLEHPGIVPVHDVGRLGDGRLFYTMKLVRGETLSRYLAAGPSLPERLRLFVRVCEAVAFAHDRGVLHRDLKPANIMVGSFGEVMVMDWGVAKVLRGGGSGADGSDGAAREPSESDRDAPRDEPTGAPPGRRRRSDSLTAVGAIMGTPGFMAPEQARGEVASLDERADVYSLGAVLAVLLESAAVSSEATTMALPERSVEASAGDETPRVPKRLRAVVAKAMAGDPADRYPGALALAGDVERYLDGGSVSALPERIWTRAGRFLSRHRVAVVLILVYVIVRTLVLLFAGR